MVHLADLFVARQFEAQSERKILPSDLQFNQSLSYDLENEMSKLGFKNYLNNKDKLTYKDDKIIISLDSLRKITYYKLNKCFIKSYDLVICDEFCSLLSHFDFNQIKEVEELYNNYLLESN